MSNDKIVLDGDDMRRTLVRIAHEIVEKNPEHDRLAIVGIHRRGALLARRLHELLTDLLEADVPLGELDISFYRDDLGRRAEAPTVHSTQLDFPLDGATVVIVDDVLFTGRTVRSAIEALFDYGRPARVQLAVLADRGHRELPVRPDYVGKNLPTSRAEHVNVHVVELDGVDEITITENAEVPRMRHLLSIEDLDRAAIERICDRAASFAEVADREIKKVPALRGRTVLNLFYEASTRTRSSFELAAKRLSADVVNFSASGSSVEKGESLKDTVLTLNAHKPDAIVIRAPWAGAAALVAQWTPAAIINAGDGKHEHPDPGAARRPHPAPAPRWPRRPEHLDRRRRPALARGALEHPRLPEDGRPGHGVRTADAHPPRRRGARVRRALHPLRPGRGRRRLRPAHAARAHGPGLRADPARVRQRVPGQRAPAAPGVEKVKPTLENIPANIQLPIN